MPVASVMLLLSWKKNKPCLDLSKYHHEADGTLSSFTFRLIGQELQSYADKHELAMHEVFRTLVLPLMKRPPAENGLSAKEVASIAYQCGPDTSHSLTDGLVLLYRAMGLKPATARKELLSFCEKAGISTTNRIDRAAFYYAEFYLGLKRGTLYDFNAWK